MKLISKAVVSLFIVGASAAFFLSLWQWLLPVYLPSRINFFLIQSGSMSPAINIGDIVLVLKKDGYEIGDVIVFKDEEGKIITHRVFQKEESPVSLLITKGDANQSADQGNVLGHQVVGTAVMVIPFLGKALPFVRSPAGFIVVIALPIGVLALGIIRDTFG